MSEKQAKFRAVRISWRVPELWHLLYRYCSNWLLFVGVKKNGQSSTEITQIQMATQGSYSLEASEFHDFPWPFPGLSHYFPWPCLLVLFNVFLNLLRHLEIMCAYFQDKYCFQWLSMTLGNFPWLSRPGKWKSEIPWLSRFSRTRTNPVGKCSGDNIPYLLD